MGNSSKCKAGFGITAWTGNKDTQILLFLKAGLFFIGTVVMKKRQAVVWRG
jgi:hypothetical protein